MATFVEALAYARQLLGSGQAAAAEGVYRRLLEAAPEVADVWHEAGLVELQLGRNEAAIEHLRQATTLDPRNGAFWANLGIAQRRLKRPAEAVTSFRRAIELGLSTAEMHNNLAVALKDAGLTDAALEAFTRALAINANYANGHFNRGNLLLDLGHVEEAISSYRRAIALNPGDAAAHCMLGASSYFVGRVDEALACYEQALRIQPDYSEARRNQALAWLVRGDHERGLAAFECRFECDDQLRRRDTHPTWNGEPLGGRTLLVYAEQGLGDTLQFIRYLPALEKLDGPVLAEMQAPLVPLLEASGLGRGLVAPSSSSKFDLGCPLVSLPRLLQGQLGFPFRNGPYLHAEPARVARWQARLQGLAGFKVGIVWAGKREHPYDRFRSAGLAQFAPLAAVSGVQLISLQKGASRDEIDPLASQVPLVELGDDFDATGGAFLDTAAVMKCLDLVISVDTSAAHLAGGLGVPVWVPLIVAPDWRWLLTGSRTPWYPSMTLFRQPRFGQWGPVFAAMAAKVRELIAGTKKPGSA